MFVRRQAATTARITIGGEAGQGGRLPVSNQKDLGVHQGATPIMLAAALGDLDECERVGFADLETSDERGWVALTFASACGHAAAVRLLVSKCAQVDAITPQGHTPLMVAAQNEHIAATRELLEAGAIVDQDDQMGYQALHFAALCGNLELLTLLLTYGARPNHAEQTYGWDPLVLAIFKGHADVVPALLTAGSLVNAVDKRGDTPLAVFACTHAKTPELSPAASTILRHLIVSGASLAKLVSSPRVRANPSILSNVRPALQAALVQRDFEPLRSALASSSAAPAPASAHSSVRASAPCSNTKLIRRGRPCTPLPAVLLNIVAEYACACPEDEYEERSEEDCSGSGGKSTRSRKSRISKWTARLLSKCAKLARK